MAQCLKKQVNIDFARAGLSTVVLKHISVIFQLNKMDIGEYSDFLCMCHFLPPPSLSLSLSLSLSPMTVAEVLIILDSDYLKGLLLL